jgi:hypothetical protein
VEKSFGFLDDRTDLFSLAPSTGYAQDEIPVWFEDTALELLVRERMNALSDEAISFGTFPPLASRWTRSILFFSLSW